MGSLLDYYKKILCATRITHLSPSKFSFLVSTPTEEKKGEMVGGGEGRGMSDAKKWGEEAWPEASWAVAEIWGWLKFLFSKKESS